MVDKNTLSLLHFNDNLKDETGTQWTSRSILFSSNAKWDKSVKSNGGSVHTTNANFTLGGEDFTIDFWACISGYNHDSYSRLFEITTDFNDTHNTFITNIREGIIANKSDSGFNTSFSFSYKVDNKWHHYAYVYAHNDGKLKIYIDGILVITFNVKYSKKQKVSGIYLLNGVEQGYYVNGYMDEFRLSNTIRWAGNFMPPTRPYNSAPTGLLMTKQPLNLLDKSSVKGFAVDGIQPANTSRKVAFKVDNKWNKLTTDGALSELSTQEITAGSVLAEGNSVEELTALTNVPALVGKLVYPAIALYASENATVMPTFGMTVKAEIDTTVDVYTKTAYSQEFVLHNKRDVLVKSISVDSNTKGNGKITLKARYATFNETAITDEGAEQTEKWSDYVDLLSVINVKCHKLQIKADYQVSITDGSDSATLNDVIITYAKDVVAKADGTTDLVTLTEKFTNDLTYVHAYIKHKELIDADLKAYVRLQKTPQKADFKLIGYGTGARKTYKATDSGINQDSLMVYVNGKAVYDFDFNTETSEITLVADVDVPINASYEFGWELFNYVEMQKGVSQVNDSGAYTTEYSYTIPAHEGEYTVTAIKYELIRPDGKVADEIIGVGTGKRQIIQLPHFARKETISCNGKWSYDYDSKRLTVIAPEGDNIVISYDWIAESPVVYGVMAGWAD